MLLIILASYPMCTTSLLDASLSRLLPIRTRGSPYRGNFVRRLNSIHTQWMHISTSVLRWPPKNATKRPSPLRRANELAPDDDTVLYELACSLIDIEAYPEAIQYLKSLLKRTPTHINALIDLGIGYTAQGFLEEAENVLGQALEHDEFDFGAHYHIAALYAASERFGEAFDHLDVCLDKTAQVPHGCETIYFRYTTDNNALKN